MLCISSCRLVTVWCDFLSAWRTFFATPFQVSPLATLSTSLHLSETSLYSTFIFERQFIRHRISGWQLFFFFPFVNFHTPSHCFLASVISDQNNSYQFYCGSFVHDESFFSLSLVVSRCFNCFDSDSPRAGGCCYLFVCLEACLG